MRVRLPSLLGFVLLGILPAAAQPAPNLVVILADDLGWADLGADGSGIDTPHLDQLARQGVKLTRFYASAPMCSPTRAALLTGRYPHSVGMPELASKVARPPVPLLALAHEAITIPEALKSARYRSIVVGKWHLGFTPRDFPAHHGFDEFWGSLLGTPGFWQPQDTFHNDQPVQVSSGVHFTDAITDQAVGYLDAHPSSGPPFFLYLAYNAPHYPLEAPAALVNKYRRKFRDRGFFAIYAAMVEQLDAGVGRVLRALDERKLADNTLVVFTSDNGPSAEPVAYGPEGAEYSNGPLQGYKFSTHEGGIRVPFLARWPGRIPAGTVRDTPAITMDLLPTLLAAAGVAPAAGHEIHGTSILPLLTRGEAPRRAQPSLHWENQHNAAVLAGEWKLVHPFYGAPKLFRVAGDPAETRDLAARHPEKVAELLALHEAWKARHYPQPVPRQLKKSSYIFPDPPRSKP
jgi:arylsulfatase A-like enzyme